MQSHGRPYMRGVQYVRHMYVVVSTVTGGAGEDVGLPITKLKGKPLA